MGRTVPSMGQGLLDEILSIALKTEFHYKERKYERIKNNKCSTLITYADNSISNGNVYKQLGFALIKETKWNYWYLSSEKHDKLLHRSNFMRHKLNTKLTEKEEMYKRGYRRYYDAGNKVYEMNITRN